jgi:hypothetical protein
MVARLERPRKRKGVDGRDKPGHDDRRALAMMAEGDP